MYFDAIIIGAGFSGLYQLHQCRDQIGLKTLVIEEGKEVGGTWYWNKYPGSRCDTESHIYCYTFSKEIYQNWKWKERYPKQKEILSYLKYVEKKLSLKRDIIFNNRVNSAFYLDEKNLWRVKTNKNKTFYCKYLISAVGSLSATNVPNIRGLKNFKGGWYHTGRWPNKKISFKNQKVAQIGTGSSGIQIAPVLAKSVKSLTVFQRKVLGYLRDKTTIGETITYSELATAVGHPNASRAVGSVMAMNPWPILIPCHRVVRSDGAIGNYSGEGGASTKIRLLMHEGNKFDIRGRLAY